MAWRGFHSKCRWLLSIHEPPRIRTVVDLFVARQPLLSGFGDISACFILRNELRTCILNEIMQKV